MTELAIEEHFSMLRRQSPNSQLSARAFWQAAARVSIKTGHTLNMEEPASISSEPALAPDEWHDIKCGTSWGMKIIVLHEI